MGKEGGITVSGGEPLLQLDFMTELFRLAKENGVGTVLDTAGQPFTRTEPFFSKLSSLMENTDLVMLDLKHIDPEELPLFSRWRVCLKMRGCREDSHHRRSRRERGHGGSTWVCRFRLSIWRSPGCSRWCGR